MAVEAAEAVPTARSRSDSGEDSPRASPLERMWAEGKATPAVPEPEPVPIDESPLLYKLLDDRFAGHPPATWVASLT
jgi:hypothetical protein